LTPVLAVRPDGSSTVAVPLDEYKTSQGCDIWIRLHPLFGVSSARSLLFDRGENSGYEWRIPDTNVASLDGGFVSRVAGCPYWVDLNPSPVCTVVLMRSPDGRTLVTGHRNDASTWRLVTLVV
jgi:hypothetical protein